CSSSPLTTQKAKKQNTMQTVDIPPTQQTTKPLEPVVSKELDFSPSKKGKEKESLEETPEITTTTLDVDISFDMSENFLDKIRLQSKLLNVKSLLSMDISLEKFSETSPQQKVSSVVNLLFDKYDSFSGVTLAKHLNDQSQCILKISFHNQEERDHACSVPLPNLENRISLPLNVIHTQPYVPTRSIRVTEIP
ncbi:16881_t:CDS:1, partial [Funneliformis geosporum]